MEILMNILNAIWNFTLNAVCFITVCIIFIGIIYVLEKAHSMQEQEKNQNAEER